MQNSSQLTGKLNETITTASSQAGNTAKTSGKEIGENSVKGILQDTKVKKARSVLQRKAYLKIMLRRERKSLLILTPRPDGLSSWQNIVELASRMD